MRRKLGCIATVAVLASMLVAQNNAVKVTYNHDYDFSKVKTFAVNVALAWGNPATETYAKEAVAAALSGKGWTQASAESSADVLVVIKGTAETRTIEESYYDGRLMLPACISTPAGVTNGRTIVQRFGEGTINMFDARTKALIFTAETSAVISHRDKSNEKNIRKAVKKAFKSFPPKDESF
jgi:hypothetical protein